MKKPSFKPQQRKRKRGGASFWDNEYQHAAHLALSSEPSSDLQKFTRWLARRKRHELLQQGQSVTDIGCGNGRNLIYLARDYNVSGYGYDISTTAIEQARQAAGKLPLTLEAMQLNGTLPLPDNSQALVLDMMVSHLLPKGARAKLRDEAYRILQPGGFLFMKTFLYDGDLHTPRLLKEYPGPEAQSYVHPASGSAEYVYKEKELESFLSERFIVNKMYRSHKHISKGRAFRRRTISVYAEKDIFSA